MSAVVVAWNSGGALGQCLDSLRASAQQADAQLELVVRIGSHLDLRLHITIIEALLSALEAQAVDRPRACLVHDPPEHRAVRGVDERAGRRVGTDDIATVDIRIERPRSQHRGQ